MNPLQNTASCRWGKKIDFEFSIKELVLGTPENKKSLDNL